MKKFEDARNMELDLSSIGGNRPYTLDEILDELLYYKRDAFIRRLFALKDGQSDCSRCFNAIEFKATTSDFVFNHRDINYEGEIIYDITAGNDWVWHCKTTVTWRSSLPVAGGCYNFHTDIVPNQNVKPHNIQAMTGTLMSISVIKNNLRIVTSEEAFQRDMSNM